MKIWLKFLAGAVVGVVLGLFLPSSDAVTDILGFLSQLTIQLGRFILFPLILFSASVGTYELRQEKKLRALYPRLLVFIPLSTLILVLTGVGTVLLLSPDPVPIRIEEAANFNLPGWRELVLSLVPSNFFALFTGKGTMLLPVLTVAIALGLNLSFDRLVTRPTIQVFDSLSRIFFHFNHLVMEIIALGFVPLTAASVLGLRDKPELALFGQLILVVGIAIAFAIFVLFPLILYFVGGRENPYRWLYSVLGPSLGALASGDVFFSLNLLMGHGKKNLGMPRSAGSTLFPWYILFGRGGTAMVATISFVLILRSYSSLGITPLQVLWVTGAGVLVSFMLPTFPGNGALVATALVASFFGEAMKESYLILVPVTTVLVNAGAFLDTVTAALGSMLITQRIGLQQDVKAKYYV